MAVTGGHTLRQVHWCRHLRVRSARRGKREPSHPPIALPLHTPAHLAATSLKGGGLDCVHCTPLKSSQFLPKIFAKTENLPSTFPVGTSGYFRLNGPWGQAVGGGGGARLVGSLRKPISLGVGGGLAAASGVALFMKERLVGVVVPSWWEEYHP
eukprot:scaffold4001_cov146-Isochrysis_galbana.AAC.2